MLTESTASAFSFSPPWGLESCDLRRNEVGYLVALQACNPE